MNVAYAFTETNTGGAEGLPFEPHHIQYLRERAVDPEWAAYAGLRAVSAEEGARLLGRSSPLPCPGLIIPYPNAPEYYRAQLDDRIKAGTKALVPANVEVPIYIPPGCLVDVVDTPLFVVEGPVKALALKGRGFDAVGLGGTATTLTTKGGDRFLNPSWDGIALQGRQVVVVCDSNRKTNPNVARDEARQTLALERAGAKVRVAALPARPDGKDQGPDDFLASQGTAALQAVVDAAVPANPVERVQYMLMHFDTSDERSRAAAALLDDLPFLASVKERGLGAEKEVLRLLNKLKVTASDVRRAMKRMEDKAKGKTEAQMESVSSCSRYAVHNGQLCVVSRIGDAVTHEPICNFAASILHEEVLDDGIEEQRRFTVVGMLAMGEQLHAVHISPSELATDAWPLTKWGAKAVVFALPRAAGHLRAAIQENSIPTSSTTYTHTGLRKHNGDWVYLHADGAVGAADVSVNIDDNFHRYKLPDVAENIADATLLSLAFLDVADPRITAPLHAAVYRAPLQSILYCDAAISLYGPSGSLKSSVSAVALSHYGDFDHKSLPLSWLSTANAIEAHLFTMKDALVVIDDYVPKSADPGDEFHKKAAQVFRSIGNGSARQRLTRDLHLRQSRPPRALVMTTGELQAEGASIRARTVAVGMRRDDVDPARLKRLQLARGRLSHALRGYVEWLLPRLDSIRTEVAEIHEKYASDLQGRGDVHLRAPEAMAHLLVGAHYFAEFAVDLGVFDVAGADAYLEKVKAALVANSREQARLATETKPTQRFLAVLKSLLTQGKVGLVSMHQPLTRMSEYGAVPTPSKIGGTKNIGWVNDQFIRLLPEAAYESFVQTLRAMNEPMPLDQHTLWAQCVEEGLASKGDGGHLLPKRRVGGERPRVVELPKHRLLDPSDIGERNAGKCGHSLADPDDEDPDGEPEGDGPMDGRTGLEGDAGARGVGQSSVGRGMDAGSPLRHPGLGHLSAPVAPPRPHLGPTGGSSTSSANPADYDRWPHWPQFLEGTCSERDDSQRVGEAPALCSAPCIEASPTPGNMGPVGPTGVSAQSTTGIPSSPEGPRWGQPGAVKDQGGATSGQMARQGAHHTPDVAAFAAAATRAGRVGMAMRSTGPRAIVDRPSLLALATPSGETCWVDLAKPGALGPLADVLRDVTVVGHDMKAPLMHLAHHLGVEPNATIDTMLLWKLRDVGEHIDDPKHFTFDRARTEAGLCSNDNARAGAIRRREDQAALAEARDVLRIADCLRGELKQCQLEEAAELELALLPHIAQMELAGVPINRAEWGSVVAEWEAESAQIKKRFEARGANIHSDRNVQALLREEGIIVPRTGSDVLAPFAHVPLVQDLVRFRSLYGFVAGPGKDVMRLLDENGRVHASWHQLGAATGRMSCSRPNLLALPRDNKIRGCIQAPPGKKLIGADYNAIELRVLADFTGDERLVELFQQGRDPHTETAMHILGVSPSTVTKDARDRAKAINFGMMNGMGAASLVTYALENFKIVMSLEEAEEYMRKYFDLYIHVLFWHEYVGEEKPDALRTASGRIRYFDKPNQYNAKLCTPIQGTAADGLKQAMVLLAPRLRPLGAQMILAVHDELLVEAPEAHAKEVKELMRDCMIAGMKKYVPSVPIMVEPKVMSRWEK